MKNSRKLTNILLIIPILFLLVSLTSCSKKIRAGLPGEYIDSANLSGFVQVRDWGDEPSEYFQEDYIESIKQYLKNNPDVFNNPDRTVDVLAISGGGSKGAFGIGVLKGWDDFGELPEFKLVTGISTGALLAPFAFLGGEHLDTAARLYTSITDDDVYIKKSFTSILYSIFRSDSLSSSLPLQSLLEKHITQKFLEEIAQEHQKGRRLYVGTTNLDAKRLVIWNMGHIAEIGDESAVKLFRKIMLASAAIPIALPPVYFSVEANGKYYDEMHVDGGASVEVFFFGSILDLNAGRETFHVKKEELPTIRIFILRNSIIESNYEVVDPTIIDIASNSLSHLLGSQGVGDLYRIYTISQKEGYEYHLASIPSDYNYKAKSAFDLVEMKMLYDLGYEMAKNGYPWENYPPNFPE